MGEAGGAAARWGARVESGGVGQMGEAEDPTAPYAGRGFLRCLGLGPPNVRHTRARQVLPAASTTLGLSPTQRPAAPVAASSAHSRTQSACAPHRDAFVEWDECAAVPDAPLGVVQVALRRHLHAHHVEHLVHANQRIGRVPAAREQLDLARGGHCTREDEVGVQSGSRMLFSPMLVG